MHLDVMPPLPRLEDQDCEGGWVTCGLGDSACSTNAEARGLVYVERHGGVGNYCAPSATKSSISGFGWVLVASAVVVVGLLSRRFVLRRRSRTAVE
jgi:hypothetical protein